MARAESSSRHCYSVTKSRRSRTRKTAAPAVVERVETRRLLATIVVNTLVDESVVNQSTSLREAVAAAATSGDTIQFQPGLAGTITLGNAGPLIIGKDLKIIGPGAADLTISGGNARRVLWITGGVSTVSGLTVSGGKAEFGAGVFNDGGQLTLDHVTVTNNAAVGATHTDNGGDARGGGIFNATNGFLTLSGCQVRSNTATGGAGQLGITAGNGGPAFGGGIYNAGGTLIISGSTFAGNTARGGTPDGGFGAAGGGNGGAAFGGAIYTVGDSGIYGSAFENNTAAGSSGADADQLGGVGGYGFGGAIYAANGVRLSIDSSTLSGNSATGGQGGASGAASNWNDGGPANGGAISAAAVLNVTASTLIGNYVIGGNRQAATGGAIASFMNLFIGASTVSGNTAKADQNPSDNPGSAGASALGGAVFMSGQGGQIDTSTLAGNQVIGGAGGKGFQLHGTSVFSAPGGDALGGALYATCNAITLSVSTVANNKAIGGAGGDADISSQSSGASGGSAVGGGIYIYGSQGVLIRHSTIAANAASGGKGGASIAEFALPGGAPGNSTGGGLSINPSGGIADTLIATNDAAKSPDVVGNVLSYGFNLIGKRDGSYGWIDFDRLGSIATPIDPKLGPLANNGGPTKTMALLPGSPAIDQGKSFAQVSDQRSLPRTADQPNVANAVGGDGTDIGAFEVQAIQWPFKTFNIGPLPLTMQAEDFDSGIEGEAYHDTDIGNVGGAYRSTGVDVQTTTDAGGGYNVGWAKAGEWLEYTVNVQATGRYDIGFRVASNGPGGTFHLESDGQDVTGPLTVPNTGGWQQWTTLTKTGVSLSAGTHVLRLALDVSSPSGGSVGNFNYLRFTPSASPVTIATNTATYVRDGAYSQTNFGASSTLDVKKNNVGYAREIYLKFDLSQAPSVSNAKLRLYGGLLDTQNPSMALAVFGSADSSWSEDSLTWANRPAAGAQVGAVTVSGTAAKWYEVDVSSYLKSEKAAGRNVVTLIVRSVQTTNVLCRFNSDEAASNRPELSIAA